MALITCPECKKKISDKAASCPDCGCVVTKRKKRGGCLGFIILLLLISVIMSYAFYENPTGRKANVEKPKPHEEEKKEEKVQTWQEANDEYEAWISDTRAKMKRDLFLSSGEVLPLKLYIKDNMHNPKSYEHVKTEILDEKRWVLVVKTTFRGTNKFGAVVLNTVTAKVHLKGEIIEVTQEE